MYKATIEQARLELKKFESLPNEKLGREALAKGLEALVSVKYSTEDTNTINFCDDLISTYRFRVEEKVESVLDVKPSIRWEILKHWCEVMAEFTSLEVQVPDKFMQLKSRLQSDYIAKYTKQYGPLGKGELREFLERN